MLPQYVDFIKWVNRFLHDGSSAYIERSGDPSTPISGELDLYAKDKSGTSALYYKNDAGTVLDLSGGLTGSGTSGRVAFWDGTLSLSSDTDLTFSVDTLTATKLSIPTNLALTGTATANIAAMTQGSIPFFGAAGLLSQDNTGLFYDDTNNDLLVGGTAVPTGVNTGRGLVVVRSGGTQAALTMIQNGVIGLAGNLNIYVTRGTFASP